jgi:hypothetical protein
MDVGKMTSYAINLLRSSNFVVVDINEVNVVHNNHLEKNL